MSETSAPIQPQRPLKTSDPSPINDNNYHKLRSNTFSSLFSNSRSSTFFKRHRSEIYQENDEFSSGFFGLLCTLGPKIKYKIHNIWMRIKVYKRRLRKKNLSKPKTLEQL